MPAETPGGPRDDEWQKRESERDAERKARDRKDKRDVAAALIFARLVNADHASNRAKAKQAKDAADILLEELGI